LFFLSTRERVTRQTHSVVKRSKNQVKLRRSTRLMARKYGHKKLKVPFLITATDK